MAKSKTNVSSRMIDKKKQALCKRCGNKRVMTRVFPVVGKSYMRYDCCVC